jgi:hypothetical protein
MEYREPITYKNRHGWRRDVAVSSHKKCDHHYGGSPTMVHGKFINLGGVGDSLQFRPMSLVKVNASDRSSLRVALDDRIHYFSGQSSGDILRKFHSTHKNNMVCERPGCFEYIYYKDSDMCKWDWDRVQSVGKLQFETYLKLLGHLIKELPTSDQRIALGDDIISLIRELNKKRTPSIAT